MLSERGAWSAKRHILPVDRMAGATANKAEGILLPVAIRRDQKRLGDKSPIRRKKPVSIAT